MPKTFLICSANYRCFHLSRQLFSASKSLRQKPPKSNKQTSQPSLRHVPTGNRKPDISDKQDTTTSSTSQLNHTSPYYDGNSSQTGSLKTCTTASTCEHYDLATAVDLLYKMGLRSATVLLPGEMVHVKYPFGAGKVADVLILSNGTVVAWGMTESEVMDQVVPALELAEVRHYKIAETEDMDYVEFEVENEQTDSETPDQQFSLPSESKDIGSVIKPKSIQSQQDSVSPLAHSTPQSSAMIGDVIYIRGDNVTSRLLDKAAFSSGLARNTKLAALEISLENYIKSIKELSDNLAEGRKIELRGSEVLQITGKLLQIRGHLNLYSELIETPDLYWSEPQLEQLYTLISRKLDVSPRIAILNKRLDYASELAGILKTHISEEQSTRLEWMIIILITVEVCFEIIHFAEKYWP